MLVRPPLWLIASSAVAQIPASRKGDAKKSQPAVWEFLPPFVFRLIGRIGVHMYVMPTSVCRSEAQRSVSFMLMLWLRQNCAGNPRLSSRTTNIGVTLHRHYKAPSRGTCISVYSYLCGYQKLKVYYLWGPKSWCPPVWRHFETQNVLLVTGLQSGLGWGLAIHFSWLG